MGDEVPLNAVDQHVGARIRARRLMLQISEDGLAGMLAISVSELAAFEEGRARIGHDLLLQMADVLEVAERYFYLGFGSDGPGTGSARPDWLSEVDIWFSSQLFPHERTLLAVARRMTGNDDTARDLLQETYAYLLTGEKWRGLLNPPAFAMRALQAFAGKLLRRARIVPMDLIANMDAIHHTDLSPDAYEILSAKEKRRIILEAIEALPPQCRRVVKLRRLKEMLPKDIAAELGISVSAVEKRLARGMSLLADKLSEQEPALRSVAAADGKSATVGE